MPTEGLPQRPDQVVFFMPRVQRQYQRKEKDESWGKKTGIWSKMGRKCRANRRFRPIYSWEQTGSASRRGEFCGQGQAWPWERHVGAETCLFSLLPHPSLRAACAPVWTHMLDPASPSPSLSAFALSACSAGFSSVKCFLYYSCPCSVPRILSIDLIIAAITLLQLF